MFQVPGAGYAFWLIWGITSGAHCTTPLSRRTEDEPGPEKSLGQILANALLHAALHPGFSFLPTSTTHTLPERVSEKSYSNPRHIWTGGVASKGRVGNLPQFPPPPLRLFLFAFLSNPLSLRCWVSPPPPTWKYQPGYSLPLWQPLLSLFTWKCQPAKPPPPPSKDAIMLWSALPQSAVLLHCMSVFLQFNPLKLIRSQPPLLHPRGPLLVGTRPQRGGGGLYGPQNCRTEQCALSAPEAPDILF